jgi:YHS domain-containing protein
MRGGKASGISQLRRSGNGKVFAARSRHARINSSQGGIMTTDPVCGMRVDETTTEFQTAFAGRKYFFCSEECRKEFEADPAEFVETAA